MPRSADAARRCARHIPLFDRSGKANLGHALETCVLLELDRHGAEVGYVHTADGYEVDFLARYPDGRQELIQVCASLDAPATRERETRALLDADNTTEPACTW